MSERYAVCRTCKGHGCGFCGDTGFSGDAMDYLYPHLALRTPRTKKSVIKPSQSFLIESAVNAFKKHTQKEVVMSNLVTTANTQTSVGERYGFTPEQVDLIKRTVAKNATDDELDLFFTRCKMLQLNPLMPGQIHFIKYGNSPGTIVIGIDGFRARAHATGKLSGVRRGVIRDDKGLCIGAWVDVYRSDWQQPVHEESPLAEYHTGKGNWLKMPETMIKKVCEAAALRIAFPNDLGGLYINEEMDQAQREKGVRDFEQPIHESENHSNPVVLHVSTRKPSEAQLKRLFAISRSQHVTDAQVKEHLTSLGISSTKELNIDQYDDLCNAMLAGRFNEKKAEPGSDLDEVPAPKDSDAPPLIEEMPWEKYMQK